MSPRAGGSLSLMPQSLVAKFSQGPDAPGFAHVPQKCKAFVPEMDPGQVSSQERWASWCLGDARRQFTASGGWEMSASGWHLWVTSIKSGSGDIGMSP